jgi:hypothetical protein
MRTSGTPHPPSVRPSQACCRRWSAQSCSWADISS